MFRDYLRKAVAEKLLSLAPEFETAKMKLARPYEGSLLLRWIPQEPIHAFVHLQFVRDRDYVKLNTQWSKRGRLPAESILRGLVEPTLKEANGDVGALESLDEVWLSACEFGRDEDVFEISNPYAPIDRLRAAYSRPVAKRRFKEVCGWRGNEWENDRTHHEWGMMATVADEELTEQDAEIAVGGLRDELVSFAERYYIPYLRRTIPKLVGELAPRTSR